MKQYGIFAAALVLSASLLTGCGCTPQNETMPTQPNRPTTGTTATEPMPTTATMPETQPIESMGKDDITVPENGFASAPSEEATTTSPEGNSGMQGNSGAQGNSGMEGRARGRRMG